MNTKHTPGPWSVNESGHPDNGRTQIGSSKDWICEMYHNPDDEAEVDENEKQTKANAKLIAAAPAMLGLLQWITKVTNNPEIGIKCDAIIKQATE